MMAAASPTNLNLPARNGRNSTYEHGLSHIKPLQVMKVGHLAKLQTVDKNRHFVEGVSAMPLSSELQTAGAGADSLVLWVGMPPRAYDTSAEDIAFCSSALPVVIKLRDERVNYYALIPGDGIMPRVGVQVKFDNVFLLPDYCTLGETNLKVRRKAWHDNIDKSRRQAQKVFDIGPREKAVITTQTAEAATQTDKVSDKCSLTVLNNGVDLSRLQKLARKIAMKMAREMARKMVRKMARKMARKMLRMMLRNMARKLC